MGARKFAGPFGVFLLSVGGRRIRRRVLIPLVVFDTMSNVYFTYLRFTKCPNELVMYSPTLPKPGFRRQAWIVGCSRCDVCREERKERKRLKWRSRLSAMIDWWSANEGTVVFKTLTCHDMDYPDNYEVLRGWLQLLFKRLRRNGFRFKYWAIAERGSKTGRLHAHILFFLQKGQKYAIINDVMDTYWKKHHLAYVTHHRPVSSGAMGAAYAAKYATKAIGLRTMSSQFGWTAFMRQRRQEFYGIEGGTRQWLLIDEEERHKVLQGSEQLSPSQGYESMVNFTIVGYVESGRLTDNPLRECGGLNICGVNGELIATLTLTPSVRLIPAISTFSPPSPYVLARRARAFAAISGTLAMSRIISRVRGP